jgi:hypothetical protein
MLRSLTVIICKEGWSAKRMLTFKRIIQRKSYITPKYYLAKNEISPNWCYISQNPDANLRRRRENLSEPSHHIFMNLVWYFYLEFGTIFTKDVHVCIIKRHRQNYLCSRQQQKLGRNCKVYFQFLCSHGAREVQLRNFALQISCMKKNLIT